jgi:hypothetical protein
MHITRQFIHTIVVYICTSAGDLSNPGRQRLQLDAGIKREFFKDLFLAFNLYNADDNRPPNPAADTNDFGVVLSIGWSY